MIILYGNDNYRVDVSEIVSEKLTLDSGMICIPNDDHMRTRLFGDPVWGEVKYIKIFDNGLNSRVYNTYENVYIHKDIDFETTPKETSDDILINELNILKSGHTFNHNVSWVLNSNGDFKSDESYEQFMAYKFVRPDAVVLELGGNIGRNSMVIGSKLNNKENLVVLESDAEVAECLKKNRDDNNLKFHVEGCALSKRKLLQKANTWNTIASDHLIEGYNKVKNITIPELEERYNLTFDTLVADCEGALFHILQDDPDILDKFSMIIVENDYFNDNNRKFVEDLYVEKGFRRIYVNRHPEVSMAINEFFFEVWVK